jgi:hypothetical protein
MASHHLDDHRFSEELRSLAPVLDQCIADGCRRFYLERLSGLDSYEFEQSVADLYNLSRGVDLCYDRPSIGLGYALWYQGRRVHQGVRSLATPLLEHTGDVDILDMGAGTGATAWAVAAIEHGRRQAGGPRRRVTVHAVESSAPMTEQAKYLWTELDSAGLAGDVTVAPRHRSWTAIDDTIPEDAWAVASYVFDSSDFGRIDAVSDLFRRVLEAVQAARIYLLTTKTKAALHGRVIDALTSGDPQAWKTHDHKLRAPVWAGTMARTAAQRMEIAELTSGTERATPYWLTTSEVCTSELRWVGQRALLPPSQILLDDKQDAAAAPRARATIIAGSAGSGKSRVLVERLVRTLTEVRGRHRAERMLVTAYNKELVDQLWRWTTERLEHTDLVSREPDTGSERPSTGVRWLSGADASGRLRTIRFLNWDKVPVRLFGIPACGVAGHSGDIRNRLLRMGIQPEPAERPAAPQFLFEELQRVIYGLAAYQSPEDYLEVERVGRRRALQPAQRRLVWERLMAAPRWRTLMHVRMELHALLHDNEAVEPLFDYVFVDEGQDFTPADHEVVARLVVDRRHVVTARDETQSMHLGTSCLLPGSMDGAQWDVHELEGSYRLPLRVAEALVPLAERIIDLHTKSRANARCVLPEAAKAAVLGSRPVVMSGDRLQIAAKVARYCELQPPAADGDCVTITVADEDKELRGAIEHALGLQQRWSVHTRSMREIKGLERPFIVWSTASRLECDEGLEEWVYTALTRTTGTLVLALVDGTSELVRDVSTCLRQDRLIFWDREAELRYLTWLKETS